jgi:hypothetical protein
MFGAYSWCGNLIGFAQSKTNNGGEAVDEYYTYYKQLSKEKCVMQSGDYGPDYGATLTNSIYQNTHSDRIYYLGCYQSWSSGPNAMSGGPQQDGYTPTTCKQACGAFKYAALQAGGKCSCGNSFGSSLPGLEYGNSPPALAPV